jgi:hypothetical protein
MNWNKKRAVASFVLDGPESVIMADEDATHAREWMMQDMGFQLQDAPLQNAVAWALYRLDQDNPVRLPKFAVRISTWNAEGDRWDDEDLRISTSFHRLPVESVPSTIGMASRFARDVMLTQSKPGQLVRSIRKYYFSVSSGVVRGTHYSHQGPDVIDEDWREIISCMEPQDISNVLAERFLLPVVNHRVTVGCNHDYQRAFLAFQFKNEE